VKLLDEQLALLLFTVYDGDTLAPDHLADLRASSLTDATIAPHKPRRVPPTMIPQLFGFDVPAIRSSRYPTRRIRKSVTASRAGARPLMRRGSSFRSGRLKDEQHTTCRASQTWRFRGCAELPASATTRRERRRTQYERGAVSVPTDHYHEQRDDHESVRSDQRVPAFVDVGDLDRLIDAGTA
jgi:hypothetical protein